MEAFQIFELMFFITSVVFFLISLRYNGHLTESYDNMPRREYHRKTLRCFTPFIPALVTGAVVIIAGVDMWGMRNFEIMFSFIIMGFIASAILVVRFVYIPLISEREIKTEAA